MTQDGRALDTSSGSLDPDSVVRAQLRSQDARKRLAGTMVALQRRLNPKALAREAVQEMKETGRELAKEGVDAAMRHPLTVAGAATAIGLFLARAPLRKLLAPDATPATADSLQPKRRRAARKGNSK